MVNEPHPNSLTVRQLLSLLEGAAPEAVVCLSVPAGGIGHEVLSTIHNLTAHDRGPVIEFRVNQDLENVSPLDAE